MNIALYGAEPVRTKPWPKWPLFTQQDKDDLAAVLDDGGMTAITGPIVKQFEDSFAEKFGAKYALACTNGISSLHLALASMGVGVGDEVIVPAHTFIGSAIPIVMANAIPVFADIDAETFNIDSAALKKAITPRTKAVVVVHLNGLPAPMDEIMAIAQEYGLKVLEDACQAHGAYYKGKAAGTIGDAGCFSFFEDKVMTTGEGGMLITDSYEIYEKARCMRSCGEPTSQKIGERKYEHTMLGYNYRMSSLQAALGINQLKRLDDMVEKRNRNAAYLREALKDIKGINVPKEYDGVKNAYYKFVCKIDPTLFKTDLLTFVDAVKAEGIMCTPRYPKPLPLQEVYQNKHGYEGEGCCPFDCPKYKGSIDYSNESWPNAQKVGEEAFVLTVHPSIEKADLDDTIAAVEKTVEYFTNTNNQYSF